jgi:hypothetical protein
MTRFVLLSICVFLLTAGVYAAEEAKAPTGLKPGDIITGPADIKTKAGDILKVSKGSTLEVKAPDGDVELFFIKKGTVRGSIGAKTQVAVPFGWIAAAKDKKAEFYAESVPGGRTFVKVNKGSAILATRANKLMLKAGQGIELWTEKAKVRSLCFSTRANNQGQVMLLSQVTGALEIELLIPKATTGCIYQVEGGKRTRIESDAGSWTGGKIAIRTRLSGVEGQTGTLGPGTFALIDNSTGKIEFGFVEVDFEIIKRAIALTSEFTALATSNFFGLGK